MLPKRLIYPSLDRRFSPPTERHLRIWSCGWGASLEDDYGDSDKKESVSQKIAFVGVWAFWKAARFRGSPSVMLRENMETLIFALIASYNAHRQQEWVIAEPEEFQPFDFQALRNCPDNKPIRSSSRREAY